MLNLNSMKVVGTILKLGNTSLPKYTFTKLDQSKNSINFRDTLILITNNLFKFTTVRLQ